VALAVAASAPVSVRFLVSRARLGLVLLSFACAEPTAISPRAGTEATAAHGQLDNSFYFDAAHTTIYVKLGHVRGEEPEPVYAFMRRAFDSADSAGVRRLVIDVRSVAGSDARLLVPLIQGIVTRDRLVRSGGLYVVVGPNSFSPTQRAATLLQRYANPIFVGN
jgi:hypothetical protein